MAVTGTTTDITVSHARCPLEVEERTGTARTTGLHTTVPLTEMIQRQLYREVLEIMTGVREASPIRIRLCLDHSSDKAVSQTNKTGWVSG